MWNVPQEMEHIHVCTANHKLGKRFFPTPVDPGDFVSILEWKCV